MLSGSDSRSFSAWRLFAALGIVTAVSIGAYAESVQKAATVDTRAVAFKSASAQQGLTLTSPANVAATQSLQVDQTTTFGLSPSQGATRRASGDGALCNDYQIDDGSTETSVGFGVPAVTVWANRFTVQAGLETISAVATSFGSVPFGGNEDLVGKPFSAGIWSDPNQDGDPSDGALVSWATSTVTAGHPDTDAFQLVVIPDTTLTVGDFFFAIAWMQGDSFPAPLDQSEAGGGRSWVNGATDAVFDPDAIEDGGWADEDTVAEGIWLLRACTGGVCGNGIKEGFEECDGADDDDCPGDCQDDCTCAIRGACCDPGGKVDGCDPDQTQDECEGQPGGGNWLGEGTACYLCACETAKNECSNGKSGGAGCSDIACCTTVCDITPECCEVEWDVSCAGEAEASCVDTCGNGLCGPAESCTSCPADCGICPGCPASNCAAGIMSQSTSLDIVGGTGIACANATGTTPNAWARCFDPATEGWAVEKDGSVSMTIVSVDFGFETSPPGPLGLPVFANVYLDLNGCPASGFGTGNAVLVGTAETELAPGGDDVLLNAEFDVPIEVELPAGAGLIVEYEYLMDGSDPDNPPPIGNFAAFPGFNAEDACGVTMIRASQCGLGDWADLCALLPQFCNNEVVIVVNAITGEGDCSFEPKCGDGSCSGGEVCFDPKKGEGCEADCGICPFCGDGACDVGSNVENCESCEADCRACEDCDYSCDSDLNQSVSDVDAANQVACGVAADDTTTENAWARCFDLSENGLTEAVEINSVTIGIQQASIDGIVVNVNLYIDADGCPASGFGTANAPLLASQSILVGPGDEGSLITVNFPGTEVAAGASLIVEIEAPADGTEEPFHLFRSRANDSGQCRGNYLRTVSCGNDDWTDMATIGDPPFVDTHLVMSVSMSCVSGCGDCPPDQGGTPGEVDPVDLAGLLGCWGPKTLPGCECFDADGKNGINPLDLATLLGSWGECPLP